MALAHSSLIVTGTATDSRTRDTISFAHAARPQAFTLYVRMHELGFTGTGISASGIVLIGSLTNVAPKLALYRLAGLYQVDYANGSVTRSVFVTSTSVNPGDLVELRVTLTAAGVVQLGFARNGGSETLSSAGTAAVLPTAWNSANLLVNAFSATSQGFAAFRNIEIMAGVHTMQEMRVRAGTD